MLCVDPGCSGQSCFSWSFVAARVVSLQMLVVCNDLVCSGHPCSGTIPCGVGRANRRGFPIDHIFWPKKSGGGHNRAVPAFGYVGRVYRVAGAPNHAKLQLAAGLRRGHRSRQAAQDCGVIHCAGLPPPLCGAVTSPLSRDESARARRRGAWELHKWCLSAAVLSPRPSVDGARR